MCILARIRRGWSIIPVEVILENTDTVVPVLIELVRRGHDILLASKPGRAIVSTSEWSGVPIL